MVGRCCVGRLALVCVSVGTQVPPMGAMLRSMSEIDLLQSYAEGVVRDAAATAGLRVAVSEWLGPDNGIGAVIHEVGVHPTSPVWEAFVWLNGGDCLAIHPPARLATHFSEEASRTEVTVAIADTAQNLVQVLLWVRGLDPTWPPCPEHGGQHPRARHPSTPQMRERESTGPAHSMARWECPEGSTSIPIRKLGAPGI